MRGERGETTRASLVTVSNTLSRVLYRGSSPLFAAVAAAAIPPDFRVFSLVFLFFPVLFGFCRVPRDRANDSSQCFRGVARHLIALVVFPKAFRFLGQALGQIGIYFLSVGYKDKRSTSYISHTFPYYLYSAHPSILKFPKLVDA